MDCPPVSGSCSFSTSALKRSHQTCKFRASGLKMAGGSCVLLFLHPLLRTFLLLLLLAAHSPHCWPSVRPLCFPGARFRPEKPVPPPRFPRPRIALQLFLSHSHSFFASVRWFATRQCLCTGASRFVLHVPVACLAHFDSLRPSAASLPPLGRAIALALPFCCCNFATASAWNSSSHASELSMCFVSRSKACSHCVSTHFWCGLHRTGPAPSGSTCPSTVPEASFFWGSTLPPASVSLEFCDVCLRIFLPPATFGCNSITGTVLRLSSLDDESYLLLLFQSLFVTTEQPRRSSFVTSRAFLPRPDIRSFARTANPVFLPIDEWRFVQACGVPLFTRHKAPALLCHKPVMPIETEKFHRKKVWAIQHLNKQETQEDHWNCDYHTHKGKPRPGRLKVLHRDFEPQWLETQWLLIFLTWLSMSSIPTSSPSPDLWLCLRHGVTCRLVGPLSPCAPPCPLGLGV